MVTRLRKSIALHPWEVAAYGALIAIAFVMRIWDLDSRAMHHDESLHAYYAWGLSVGNGYTHDPMMHGPFQIEATAGIFRLFGDSDFTSRLLYVVAGTVLVGLPGLLRDRLGRLGALLVSVMLAFSPAMLYYSRFARNDIIMGTWTLGLVICMWKYLDGGKHRYLYIGAALLALMFATKENAYLVTATLGLFLTLVSVTEVWPGVHRRITIGEVSPPVAISHIVAGVWHAAVKIVRRPADSRSTAFLVLLVSLSLPLWSAFASVLQDTPLLSWTNLVLAGPVGGTGPIGAPTGGGMVLAAYIVIMLFVVGIALGFRWNITIWWRCALIFYGGLLLLYTTFFTNPDGIGSGLWQSMGYWVVQQGEARGGQPWYYHFVIGSVYEFLPLVLAIAGAVYYSRKTDRFGHFLIYWCLMTILLYSIASEKMPWLLVNIALPLIVLSGKFLGEVIGGIQWRHLVSGGGMALLPGIPLLLLSLYTLAFFTVDGWALSDVLVLGLAAVAVLALLGLGFRVARGVGYRNFAAFSTVMVAGILLVLSVRAGYVASYQHGDTPVEMLVYTQTSPDLLRLAQHIERAGAATGNPTGVPVAVERAAGFNWPWAWYLRDYNSVRFTSFDGENPQVDPAWSVVLVHERNMATLEPALGEGYQPGIRIKHRWWFPENYRGLTPGKFLASFVDRQAWRVAMDYFLHRKLRTSLGSEDAYVYFTSEFDGGFDPSL